MQKKKIPTFETLDEAINFWETHSFVDYADDTEPVSVTVNLPPSPNPSAAELKENLPEAD